ncbi:MAG: tRNA (adenosine(37)-N6)-threonylcarbamoyltransferase complex transferase subunit TsaD [Hyphomicrobiales bacterium]
MAQSAKTLTVLGIETSCDETAAAVIVRHGDGHGEILSNLVRADLAAHAVYGGIVPEIAARAHVQLVDTLIGEALKEAGVALKDIDAVAATAGPGLIGGLLVGLTAGKAIAAAAGVPLIAVNHLEGHALTVGLTEGLRPPYLLLLVSGGHTQLIEVEDVGRYRRLGTTLDDALGEAFDKTAKLLGLGYPGGPEVERLARGGDAARFDLPRPLMGSATPHFSFSGLKTALRRQAQALAPLSEKDVADLCASFEKAVTQAVTDRVSAAMDLARAGAGTPLVVAGGVAANHALRGALEALCARRGCALHLPPPALCTDNAAMIAWAGAERLARGWTDGLDVAARARWPLDPDAPPAAGAGVKA